MSRVLPEKSTLSAHKLDSEYTELSSTRSRRLEMAFAAAVLGLLLIPVILNVYSLLLMMTIRPSTLCKDSRNRYVFMWFLNIGALTLHAIFLKSLRS